MASIYNFSVTLPNNIRVAVILDNTSSFPLSVPDTTGNVAAYLRLVMQFLSQISAAATPTLIVIRRLQHQSSVPSDVPLRGPMRVPMPPQPRPPPMQPSVPQPHPSAAQSQNPAMQQAYHVWNEYYHKSNEYRTYMQQYEAARAAYDRWTSYRTRDHVTVSMTSSSQQFHGQMRFRPTYHLIPNNGFVRDGLETFTQSDMGHGNSAKLFQPEVPLVHAALAADLGPVNLQGYNGTTIR